MSPLRSPILRRSTVAALFLILIAASVAPSARGGELAINGPAELKVGFPAKLTVNPTLQYESIEAFGKQQVVWRVLPEDDCYFDEATKTDVDEKGRLTVQHKASFFPYKPGLYHIVFQLSAEGRDPVLVHTIRVIGDAPDPEPTPDPEPPPDPDPDPEPTPNPYPAPTPDWTKAVEPVRAVIRGSSAADVPMDGARLAAAFHGLAGVDVERTEALRASIVVGLRAAGCHDLYGKYPGLGTAIDKLLFAQLGKEPRAMDSEDKARARVMFSALAWAIYEGSRRDGQKGGHRR